MMGGGLLLLLVASLALGSAALLLPAAHDRYGLLVTSVALNPLPDRVSLWVNQTIDLKGVLPAHRCSLEMLGILVTALPLGENKSPDMMLALVAGTRLPHLSEERDRRGGECPNRQ